MEHHQEKKDFKSFTLKDGRTLVVRKPMVSDAEALIEQMKLVDSETKFLAREPDEFNLTVEQEVGFIKSSLENEDISFSIGLVDNTIVGNCSVGLIMNKRRFLHRAALGIAIRKDYWGNGIGKIMMKECIEWCKSKGVEQLELDVVADNERGLGLYKSLGFEVFGTKKHALKYDDGTYADEYYMILFLNK